MGGFSLSGAVLGVDPQKYQQEQTLNQGYRQQKIADTMAASNNLHKSIALLLDPNTMQPLPGKEQQVADLRNQLGQLEGYVKNLYNPKFDPQTGAVAEDPLHKLTDKLHLTKPPVQPYTDSGAPQSNPAAVTTPVNKTAGQQLSDLKNIVSQSQDTAPLTDEAAKRQQVQANIDNVRTLLKKYGATDDTIQSVTEGMLGGAKPSAEKPPKYFSQLATTTDKAGKTHAYRVPMEEGSKAEEVTFPEDQNFNNPKASVRPKSQYDQQKEEFAKSLGKTADQLTWPEEQEFIKKRNPFGDARLGISYALLKVAQANQALKENDSDFKAFQGIQKDLTPFEKINTAASNADTYVTSPSAPGDVALTFAFIEATKPSSGFRFTETERKWIIGTRGLIDGVATKINQGFTGETLSPDQRLQMAQIIKSAANQSQKDANKLLQGAGQFKPKAAAAAAGNTPSNGTQSSTQTKKKVSLKKAMALPQNAGKSEADVRKDIESHNYEVAP